VGEYPTTGADPPCPRDEPELHNSLVAGAFGVARRRAIGQTSGVPRPSPFRPLSIDPEVAPRRGGARVGLVVGLAAAAMVAASTSVVSGMGVEEDPKAPRLQENRSS